MGKVVVLMGFSEVVMLGLIGMLGWGWYGWW